MHTKNNSTCRNLRLVVFVNWLCFSSGKSLNSSALNYTDTWSDSYINGNRSMESTPSGNIGVNTQAPSNLMVPNLSACQYYRPDVPMSAGRPTTTAYKQLMNRISGLLDQISQAVDENERGGLITELNNTLMEDLDNGILPTAMLDPVCKIVKAMIYIDSSGKELKTSWKSYLEKAMQNVLESFNYTAFRETLNDEQRLLNSLMINYEKGVRPVMKASDLVELKIGLTLNQIDVDERNQVLTVLVWLDQEWTDEKLVWNSADYNGLEVLRVPCDKLWLPDIVLYNSVEDFREGYMQALTMVESNGNVFWPPIVKYRGNCEIQIKYFPFDDQICKLKLGTWAYDGSQVNVTKRKEGMDLSNYQPNGEWLLLRTRTERNVMKYSCCPNPYIDVTFVIYLRRRTLYYVYNIIIPCIMLSILTLLSFWMKPDSGEKVNLGLTILLAFSVFMLLIAESMPSTSFHVPIIGIYIISSMCLTAFSVVSAVVVANINHQAEGDRIVPYLLHKVCYQLGRVMCVKMISYEERHYNIRQLAMRALTSVRTEPQLKRESQIMAEDKDVGGKEDDPLLKRLHTIVEHQEELLRKQNTSDDWHAVAVIIDRCLFWLYMMMMVSTMVGCLVIFPRTKVSVSGSGELDEPL